VTRWPRIPVRAVPTATTAAMRAADAAAAERFGIETMQLMEVAGVQTARLAAAFLQGAAGLVGDGSA